MVFSNLRLNHPTHKQLNPLNQHSQHSQQTKLGKPAHQGLYHLLVISVLCICFALPGHTSQLLGPGAVAPKFLIANLQGKREGLKDYIPNPSKPGQKLLILNFWSLTCIPCREEMPILQSFANQHPNEVTLLFINLDSRSDGEKIPAYLSKFGITHPVLLDFYQIASKNYNVCNQNSCKVPSLFVLDSQGSILYSVEGFNPEHNLMGKLTSLLTTPHLKTPVASAPSQAQRNYEILHNALKSVPLESFAAQHGISKEQLIQIFKDAESAAKRKWEQEL